MIKQTMINTIKKIFYEPERIPLVFVRDKHFFPDFFVVKIQYRAITRQKLSLNNPLLFNEKLQWLKLYGQEIDCSNLADKYEVREYISNVIGDEYLIPLYGVWNTFDEIPFDKLPNEFVLKCTHDCGSIYICREKYSMDMDNVSKYFRKRLAYNYYWNTREKQYKNIKPRIIAEKLMIDESGGDLKDYKIFCFNGKPKIIQVDFDRFTNHKRNFYSLEWDYQPLSVKFPTDPNVIIQKPKCLDLMLELARKLSIGKTHVRVDLYVINSKIYFGELTFIHGGGYEIFDPPEWNRIFGDWIKLPKLAKKN